MSLTTDPIEARESGLRPDGQQNKYVVLSDEEIAKGFVRPVRYKYTHLKCGSVTTMGGKLSETYAREPHFYGGTFCCACGIHFPLRDFRTVELDANYGWAFMWPDGEPVGSTEAEAKEYHEEMKRKQATKNEGSGI